MGAYRLQVASSAERVLARLPEFAATAIVEFITGPPLENPHRVSMPLGLEGYLCARRGAYRVVFRIEDDLILIVRIEHRADVYRSR